MMDDRQFGTRNKRGSGDFLPDGLCSHEATHLAEGPHEIEGTKHSGIFDYRTGHAKRLPARVNPRIHPVCVDNGRVFLAL
jgi:3-phenylpropionate/trans-cinnamate dioxygenase ferredoxin subunit